MEQEEDLIISYGSGSRFHVGRQCLSND